ncbi:MAG: hypothetical protein JO128_05575, partial [Alphaproteobacteria bacterium]|nr:hypothetical protein [Alphaproteobacteria bacterium]
MHNSSNRIRTSHVGRLPTPKGWEDVPGRLAGGGITSPDEIASVVVPAITEIVETQARIGVDCVNDGEFWTSRGSFAHLTAHFGGLENRPLKPGESATTRHSTRERDEFRDFYGDMDKIGTLFFVPGEKPMPPMRHRAVARGPITWKGKDAMGRQLETFKAALARSRTPVDEAFVAVLAPGWLDHFIFNE